MTRLTARQLGRRLRRLDRVDLTRFVAALWAASGWSTAVRDGRVVARRMEPSHERLNVAIVTGPGDVGRTLVSGPADVDLLVAPVGDRSSKVLAARTGLEVVDAADLAERLTYAVEADAREHLLSTYVPGAPRAPSRRSILSALVVGTAGAGGLALTLGSGDGRGLPSMLQSGPDGRQPDGGAESDGSGPATGSPGADDATATAAPQDSTPDGASAPGDGCDTGPAETIARQVVILMKYFPLEDGSDIDGDGDTEEGGPDPSDAFLEAAEAAGVGPIRYATSASIGQVLDLGTEARVPLVVRTRGEREVLYEFSLTMTPEDCWRTRSAEIIAKRTIAD